MPDPTQPQAPAVPPESRGIKRFFDVAYRTIFGFDYFISYTWRDTDDPDQRYVAECARHYAVKLRDALRQQQFVCFLDSDDYAKGQNWRWFGQAALRGTSRLILILSPAVAESQAVLDEVEYFKKTTGKAMVPVEFIGCPPQGDTSRILSLVDIETLRIREPAAALRDGPTPYAIGELVKTFNLTRQVAIRHRIMSATVGVLTTLLIAVALVGWLAFVKKKEAEAEAWKAKHNLAVNDLANAGFAIREHRTVDALHWYLRACEHAPDGDWVPHSARRLLGAWSRPIQATLVHDSWVSAAAFSPDGKTVLTGSADKTARLWNAYTGEAVCGPLKHDEGVTVVAFSPDSQTVLTGSFDKTVRLWDAATGEARGKPLVHDATVYALALSSDGQSVFTASGELDGGVVEVRVYDARNGHLVTPPLKYDGLVNAVAFSPDAQTVLVGEGHVGDKTGRARLRDARTGHGRGELLQHDGLVWSVAFSRDSETVLTGGTDGTVRLWDARTGTAKGGPLKQEGPILAMALSPNGETVLSGSQDHTARLWDARTGEARSVPLKHDDSVYAVAFGPDGQTVLTGSGDNTARLWDTRTGQMLGKPLKHGGEVHSVAFSPDSQTVITGSGDFVQNDGFVSNNGGTQLWDARTGQTLGAPLNQSVVVYAVAFSSNGQMILTGGHDEAARLWDARTRQAIGKPLKHDGEVRSVTFGPDDHTLLTVNDVWEVTFHANQIVSSSPSHKTARLWDARTGTVRGEPMKHEGSAVAIAFGPDGQIVLAGDQDDTARLRNARTGELQGVPLKHEGWVLAVAFSPNGQSVVTGSQDNTARLWDARTGLARGAPLRHGSWVQAVAFSPDSKTVLTGCGDQTARLWDAQTGSPQGEPIKLALDVVSVAFSPNGDMVLTGCRNSGEAMGEVRLWETRTGQWLGTALKHGDVVWPAVLSPDGQILLTANDERTVQLWEVSPPAAEDLECLRLSVQVRTGSEFDENSGTIRRLSQADWLKRAERLRKEFGGPCDVRTWNQVSIPEKQRLGGPHN